MASNSFTPTLPSPGGPSNIISPVLLDKQPSDMQQLVGALPELAGVFAQLYKTNQANKAADESGQVLGQAMADQRAILEEQDSISAAQSDVITGAKQYENTFKGLQAGPLPERETKVLAEFEQNIVKLQLAEQQGKLKPGYMNTQLNKKFDEYRTQYPRLAGDLNEIFRVSTGGGSTSNTGSVDPAKLQLMNQVKMKYGSVTPENMVLEAKKMAPLILAKQNKELGDISFSNTSIGLDAGIALSMDTDTSVATQLFNKQQMLTEPQVQSFLSKSRQSREEAKNALYRNITAAQAQGEIFDPAEVRSYVDSIDARFDAHDKFFTEKHITARLGEYNELSNAMYKANFGNRLEVGKSIIMAGGPGMSQVVTNALQTKNASDLQVVKSLYGDTTGKKLSSLDQIQNVMIEAADALSKNIVIPGYEGVQAWAHFQAVKSGKKVEAPVIDAGGQAMDSLVKNPTDAVSALNNYNDIEYSSNLVKNTPEAVPGVLNNVRAYESLVRRDLSKAVQDSGGYTTLYVNPRTGDTQVLTTAPVKVGGTRTQKAVITKAPDISKEVLVPVTQQTGRGGDKTIIGYEDSQGTLWEIDRTKTSQVRSLEKTYKNPSYKGQVESYKDWLFGLQEELTFKPE